MGTPAAAVPTLDKLVEAGHEVVAVWTQADKPAGRGNKLKASAVKEIALELGLDVYQPLKIKTDEARELFASHNADVAVVVAYGKILPREFLSAPKRGCVNVHFSLLPKWRGAAPVNWAIIAGDATTGVTTMQMDEGLDTGAILLQRETTIKKDETAGELMERLAVDGAELSIETLEKFDEIVPCEQIGEASYAGLLTSEISRIDWRMSAGEIERRVRGLQPAPLAHGVLQSRRLIVWRADVANIAISEISDCASGQVVQAKGDEFIVACDDGKSSLRLIEVQPEGKRKMAVRDMLNGARVEVGMRFE